MSNDSADTTIQRPNNIKETLLIRSLLLNPTIVEELSTCSSRLFGSKCKLVLAEYLREQGHRLPRKMNGIDIGLYALEQLFEKTTETVKTSGEELIPQPGIVAPVTYQGLAFQRIPGVILDLPVIQFRIVSNKGENRITFVLPTKQYAHTMIAMDDTTPYFLPDQINIITTIFPSIDPYI